MNNDMILESLASDLKRVSLGLQRGSQKMVDRFMVEAVNRTQEVEQSKIPSHIQLILERIKRLSSALSEDRAAEDALMYSTLIQNYVLQIRHYNLHYHSTATSYRLK